MTMPSADHQPDLSVLVMTYNEEANLPRCLASVAGLGGELFILDSYSTDRTVDIARQFGARVEQHVFESYPAQRDRLIRMARHNWILYLDADESLTPALRAAIVQALQARRFDGYWMNRLSRIGNHWIRHGTWYPDRKMRLFDRRKVMVVGEDPHDSILPAEGARAGYLTGDLLHEGDADLSSRFRTLEKYAVRAACALEKRGIRPSLWRMLVKPAARFFKSFFLRRGFLDGYYGWFVAKSEANYVWMREVILYDLKARAKG